MSRDRREFPKAIKQAAFARAQGRCECDVIRDGVAIRCNAVLIPSRVEYDHRIPDEMGGEPTLENCVAACILCHAEKTKQDVRKIAKAKRIEARETNTQARNAARKIESAGFQKSSKPRRERHPEQTGMTEIQRRYGL